MATQHIASATDCIESIAYTYGVLPEFVWDAPENAELRELRQNPNVLLAGDVVVIPDRRLQEYSRASEQRHRFIRKAVPAHVEFRVTRLGQPVANAPYTLTIGSTVLEGTTDGDGKLRAPILPNAFSGELRVKDGTDELVYTLDLGAMDPIEEILGVQQRLINLGYPIPQEELGASLDGTRVALTRFQRDHQLEMTGEADDATRAKLVERTGH